MKYDLEKNGRLLKSEKWNWAKTYVSCCIRYNKRSRQF